MQAHANPDLATLPEDAFRRVCEAVHRHCGITLNDSKRDLVRARIVREMRATGIASAEEYVARALGQGGEPFTRLIDALSTNLTSFYREGQHFEYLAGTFLPPLLRAREAAGDRRVVAWTAACSTGEEAYTITLVVRDAIEKTLGTSADTWDVRLLATDISTRVLEKARAGEYEAANAGRLPAELRKGLSCVPGKATLRVADHVRAAVRFRHLNLMEEWPFRGPFDFVFCRNVMIYFDLPTQRRLVSRLRDCLRPGGLLFSGLSESLTGVSHGMTHRGPSIYQKP